ncbi:hypothetical protein [Brachyspira sp.]|uniref:hypothetical protein n=1 Tax=Brachyspira sp. TaxID=1977261 RepID=UPI003D7DCC79
MKRKVITMGILHSNKFNYFKYPPQKYSGDIINDINKAKIYESALDESIDLTINYFNEIKNYLKKTQSNLFNINYDWNEKYYNDFQVHESFNNYIEDKNNKLENMYKELNDKYNNLASVFNEVVDKVAWWIPFKKFMENFRNKFRIVI